MKSIRFASGVMLCLAATFFAFAGFCAGRVPDSQKAAPETLFKQIFSPGLLSDLKDTKKDLSLPGNPASLSELLWASPVNEFRNLISNGILYNLDLQELLFMYAARRASHVDHETFEKERLAVMIDEGILSLGLRPGGKETVRKVLGWLPPARDGDRSWLENAKVISNLGSVRVALGPEVDGKTLATLREEFARLRASPGWRELDPEIDVRRLANPADWEQFQQNNPDSPWLVYGERTWKTWEAAARFVARDADHEPISLSLLKKIHRISLAGHYFRGFEVRRIQQAMQNGVLNKEQGKELLRQIAVEGKETHFSGVNHADLEGRFRWDKLDNFVHNGEWVDETGQRLMTAYELEKIRHNPYWKPKEDPMREIAPGVIVGEFLYPDVSTLSRETLRVLARVNARLSRSPTDLEVLGIVAEMNQCLVAIHPFMDGNGRAIRLLGDLILQRRGLPPPIFLPENEFFMTTNQLVEMYVDGMRRWLELKKGN